MKKIDIETAENLMLELLDKEDMGDRLYEFAQDLFQRYVAYIESSHTIVNKDVLDRYEEWYDGIMEYFFQEVYNKVTEYLTQKN